MYHITRNEKTSFGVAQWKVHTFMTRVCLGRDRLYVRYSWELDCLKTRCTRDTTISVLWGMIPLKHLKFALNTHDAPLLITFHNNHVVLRLPRVNALIHACSGVFDSYNRSCFSNRNRILWIDVYLNIGTFKSDPERQDIDTHYSALRSSISHYTMLLSYLNIMNKRLRSSRINQTASHKCSTNWNRGIDLQ